VAPLCVRLDRLIDKPCGRCGSTVVTVGAGAGPHIASLRCFTCDRHRGWLPKPTMDFLNETARLFGVPDKPPTIRDTTHTKLRGQTEMKRSELFPSRFLKHSDLQGRAITVTIESVQQEEVGDEERLKPVVHFRGRQKGLVLNATNYDTLADIYGDETDDWVGLLIELYPARTPFKGKMTDCIRVRVPEAKQPPKQQPQPVVKPATADDEMDDEIPF
jgi:hypothetical protein